MTYNDAVPADHYDRYGCDRYNGDPVSSFFAVSGREADAEIYSVSWKGFAGSSIWAVGCLLPEKCERFYRQPRYPGIAVDHPCSCASLVEKTNASVYCRRNCMLYVVGTVYFLRILAT